MKILSKDLDKRINCLNLYMECTYKEYLQFATKIISNNDLQRKRIKSSKTIYSLLKDDLKKGCIIPPIVLATHNGANTQAIAEDKSNQLLIREIENNKDNLLILDGLQRTYTLIDAYKELKEAKQLKSTNFLNNKLRLEIYISINKFGILYRMLTLNTGQTPMSLRHQLEMLYSDLLNVKIDGIILVPEIKGPAKIENNEFAFKNVIDGFNAYLTRNEIPYDRTDILENIKTLENMSFEDSSKDVFQEFIDAYIRFFNLIVKITNNKTINLDDFEEGVTYSDFFAKDVMNMFASSLALSGFGAALGKLKEREIIKSMDNLNEILGDIEQNFDSESDWFYDILQNLDKIRRESKKIGNSQRMYFQYFFRELLNKESDSYADLQKAVDNGYKKYYSQVG